MRTFEISKRIDMLNKSNIDNFKNSFLRGICIAITIYIGIETIAVIVNNINYF